MKHTLLILAVIVSSQVFAGKPKPVETKPLMANELDSVSYCMGTAIGTTMKQAGFEKINTQLFLQAMNEVLDNKPTVITVEQTNSIIQNYLYKMQAKAGKKNLEEGKQFLEANSKKEGVITLPSGLQYKVVTEGTGDIPGSTDKVTVHYTGKLLNGKVFDSSVQRGQPATFPLDGVIKGWTEALQLMKTGSKWILFIPSDLAYGEQGTQAIEPNSVLIFEVELISVEKKQQQ
jgi:FKBP-type peptidyl-prolyl cis-trans isomerase FklB